MFRLAMRTGFCYVNRPLVLFDRAPAEDRHVGVSSAWNKMDFFLQDSQLRLEGLLHLAKACRPRFASWFETARRNPQRVGQLLSRSRRLRNGSRSRAQKPRR